VIGEVYADSGYYWDEGYVYVDSYYDGDSSGEYGSDVWGYGYSGLGSESGYAYYDASYSNDAYFDSYNEVDFSSYYTDQYYFTYYYGNGDSYSGYGYASAGTYTPEQVLSPYSNETGNDGEYVIGEVYAGYGYYWDEGYVYVNSYYDGDSSGESAYYANGYGYSGLGSESGYAYDASYSNDGYFSYYDEVDFSSDEGTDYYTFTYYYGNGDYYSGYGYAASGTYTSGQVLSPYSNETGFDGQYVIDFVDGGYYGYIDQVVVTSYFDSDTGYGLATAYGNGSTGLGSEVGTAYGTVTDVFSNQDEADLSDPTLGNDLAAIVLGLGIQASNIIYIGDLNGAGVFDDPSFGIGITSGIVLSTGKVADIYGPNDSDSTSTDFYKAGDPGLDALVSPSATQDAAILEFDFIPTADFLSFDYVFASEEYNEFVGSSYNDVFGFFITDPDGNTVNIALIPGTDTPIAINNVNLDQNSAYYRNNDLSDYPSGTPFNTEFDGLTTVLTAVANVTPGAGYHFKLAIADNSDGIYDSAVFITGSSFEATPLVAVGDSIEIFQNVLTNINVLANDLVGQSQTAGLASFDTNSEKGGTLTRFNNNTPNDNSDDQIVYQPVLDFVGLDTFTYVLTDANGNTSEAIVSVQVKAISNEQTKLEIAAVNASQSEGDSGNKAFTFTVERSGDLTDTTEVNWSLAGTGDNPANAVDFGGTLPSGILTFEPGQESKTIQINVSGDTTIEPDETFAVTLSNPTGTATIAEATATGTIQNDDYTNIETQIITSDTNLQATPDGTLTIPLYYNTSTDDNTLTGIGLRLHYNSSELTFDSTANLLSSGLFGEVEDLEDTLNYDFDTNTDRYLVLQYADFNGSWPNETLPLKLADFIFTASESFENTSLKITSDNLAAGYQLQADTLLVSQGSSSQWNLDIDGNGVVDALTDGIMAVRYMFNQTNGSFAGDALTAGAIAPDATRNLEQIQNHLQEGFDNLSLDIDGNSQVDALTDGIMAVRYMFNQTNGSFADDALTDGAIAPNATRDLDAILAHLAEIYI
jgi:hypothetical protein